MFSAHTRRSARCATVALVGLTVLVLLVLALTAISCGGTASTTTSGGVATTAGVTTTAGTGTTAAGGTGGQVTIENFSFNPASVTVKVGDTVTWTNKDSTAHTVTADNGEFKSNSLPTGQTFSFTFTKAGTYAYHCSIHPTMKGTVVVQ